MTEHDEMGYAYMCVGQWIRSSDMSKAGGRSWDDWYESGEARQHVDALAEQLGCANVIMTIDGVTLVHPVLAIRFAKWCSEDFGAWTEKKVDEMVASRLR